MKSLEFKTVINAPANTVWFVLWDDYHYREWTSVFTEGSYAISNWQEGSEVQFLSPSGAGMYSLIDKALPGESMHFKHIGEIRNFEKQALDEKTLEWTGAMEKYDLEETNGVTTLTVTLEASDDTLEMFKGILPKALVIVKQLAEDISITISADINAPVDTVWKIWTEPEHIIQWNAASDDWHTTRAENDLRAGGRFLSRMEAKDGSFGFDFGGEYNEIIPNELIIYTLGDGRKVEITFSGAGPHTKVTTAFKPETVNSLELQRGGWQAILNNFKKHVERQA